MRTYKLSLCLLVAATLFTLGGCKKEVLVKSQVAVVAINNCVAAPDEVKVHENDQVDWQASDHDYTIRFNDPNEPTANPIKVVHGGEHHPHLIHGHSGCDPLGHGEFYCKYRLTKDSDPSPCADPGVHIIP